MVDFNAGFGRQSNFYYGSQGGLYGPRPTLISDYDLLFGGTPYGENPLLDDSYSADFMYSRSNGDDDGGSSWWDWGKWILGGAAALVGASFAFGDKNPGFLGKIRDGIKGIWNKFFGSDDSSVGHRDEYSYPPQEITDAQRKTAKENGTDSLSFTRPVAGGRISSHHGMREHPIEGGLKMHNGDDIAVGKGTPVNVTADGIVVDVQDEDKGKYGRYIDVLHYDKKEGIYYLTRYAHLDKTDVTIDQEVKQGDVIGKSGDSGAVTGEHLHYEIHKGDAEGVDFKTIDPKLNDA
ncbi:MAG: M23 family metallopeptidase [Vampirovibrio sp.]|nr:M23 family metallopeptidase [Vampirovibrio sp.]